MTAKRPDQPAHGEGLGSADAARAHCRQPRGGPPAAAHARRADGARRRDSSSRRADDASSAAPSWRRSARTWPKSARSPSTRRERGGGVGTMIVDELRRRARREGFEKLCAFTHAPGYFIQMGFSIVPHTWLPEKISRPTASSARCSEHAASTRWWCRSTTLEARPLNRPTTSAWPRVAHQ